MEGPAQAGVRFACEFSEGNEAAMHSAAGTFEVKMKPEALSEVAAQTKITRMSIDKVFHGQIEGTSQGEFLASGTADGSGGYVAIERVTGTLDGHAGSFVLQHTATMNQKVPTMSVTVVPGSATGDLAGLSGTFTVIMKDGKHSYEFAYTR